MGFVARLGEKFTASLTWLLLSSFCTLPLVFPGSWLDVKSVLTVLGAGLRVAPGVARTAAIVSLLAKSTNSVLLRSVSACELVPGGFDGIVLVAFPWVSDCAGKLAIFALCFAACDRVVLELK